MTRRLRIVYMSTVFAAAGLVVPLAGALAQQRVIRVLGDDGQPVPFANVTIAGERLKITGENGEVEVGVDARASLTVDIRRLGYEPWYGALALGDTLTVARVTLHRISRRLFTVKVTDSSRALPAYLRGFYERMLARQRGIGSGIYMTPEEVDKRNTTLASTLLQGLNGVTLQHTSSGKIVAMSSDGQCQMSVLVDGHRVCPDAGCDGPTNVPSSSSSSSASPARKAASRTSINVSRPSDDQFTLIDKVVNASEVAAVEVYPRGASVPPSLPSTNSACGVVAIWTGGRKAP